MVLVIFTGCILQVALVFMLLAQSGIAGIWLFRPVGWFISACGHWRFISMAAGRSTVRDRVYSGAPACLTEHQACCNKELSGKGVL